MTREGGRCTTDPARKWNNPLDEFRATARQHLRVREKLLRHFPRVQSHFTVIVNFNT